MLEALSLLLLAASAVYEKTRTGIQLELIAVALVLGVLHLQRLRGEKVSRLATAFELAALGATFAAHPPPKLSLTLAALAALSAPKDEERSPALLRALSVLSVVAALGALVYRIEHPAPFEYLWQYKSAFLGVALALIALNTANAPRTIAGATIAIVASTRATFPGESLALSWLAFGALVSFLTRNVPESERPRARVRTTLRLATSLGALAIAWLVGEAAFRLVPNHYRDVARPQPDTFHKPGATTLYEGAPLGKKQDHVVLTRWNQHGWKDVDHAPAKPPGKKRVLVLGDSFVEGTQVELDELYHRRLERLLPGTEAISLATSGWGQIEELSALEGEGFSYSPDLVVVEFLPMNDVRNDEPELERIARDESFTSSFARPLYFQAMAESLYFAAFFMDHLDATLKNARGRRDPIDAEVYREKPRLEPELWARAWRDVEELVAKFEKACSAHGARLLFVVFPSLVELGTPTADLDGLLPARRMLEICARQKVPCLDLTPRFAKVESKERLYIAGDGHWSAAGHALGAEETARYLEESGWLR